MKRNHIAIIVGTLIFMIVVALFVFLNKEKSIWYIITNSLMSGVLFGIILTVIVRQKQGK